jgi:chorismate lyase/3-hydroxybenzoate synthase
MHPSSLTTAVPSASPVGIPVIRQAYTSADRFLPLANEALLGVISYGTGSDLSKLSGVPCATIPLDPLDGSSGLEAWYAPGSAVYGETSGIRYATTGNLLFGIARVDAENPDTATQELYGRIIGLVRTMNYPALIRMWNYLSAINQEQLGLERYRGFSVGRHQAFVEAGFALGADLPAASAIGSGHDGLWVFFVAAREGALQVENPRQISAYHYPSEYGPRSPSFSRAMLFGEDATQTLLISGTASVLGHQTIHPGALIPQCEVTLANLQTLLDQVQGGTLADLGEAAAWKVYLRHPGDYAATRDYLAGTLHPASPVLYLTGDICRSDLLVEIEGVVQIHGGRRGMSAQ